MHSTIGFGKPLSQESHANLREELIFNHCKWDPQVEDVPVLAPFPLLVAAGEWRRVCTWAEALARETLAAEAELLQSPELLHELALPGAIEKLLRRRTTDPARGMARVMRFDFHLAEGGWRISEVNSDVPGGYIEASAFTQLMAQHHNGCTVTGNPAMSLARALANALPGGARVALVHATAYSDDAQVMHFLKRLLAKQGVEAHLAAPDHLQWKKDIAHLAQGARQCPCTDSSGSFPQNGSPSFPGGAGGSCSSWARRRRSQIRGHRSSRRASASHSCGIA